MHNCHAPLRTNLVGGSALFFFILAILISGRVPKICDVCVGSAREYGGEQSNQLSIVLVSNFILISFMLYGTGCCSQLYHEQAICTISTQSKWGRLNELP